MEVKVTISAAIDEIQIEHVVMQLTKSKAVENRLGLCYYHYAFIKVGMRILGSHLSAVPISISPFIASHNYATWLVILDLNL